MSHSSGRYLVAVQRIDALGASVRKTYCRTIAEVRKALSTEMRGWSTADEAHTMINGFAVSALPAAMVKTRTLRHGRCPVGKAVSVSGNKVIASEEISVILLDL